MALLLLYGQVEVMAMKRFLILVVLIAFATMNCAGPNKAKWTKPDFRQDQLEKDYQECMQTGKGDPDQEVMVEECLALRGYESQPGPHPEKEKPDVAKMVKAVGAALLITAGVALLCAVTIVGAAAQFSVGH
jgi:hypothetical protein